jgi:hypothetical protein
MPTQLWMCDAFFARAVAAEEVEGDLPQILAADPAAGAREVGEVPAADAVGQQQEAMGLGGPGAAVGAVFGWEAERWIGGVPAADDEVAGIGVGAEPGEIGGGFGEERMVGTEDFGAVVGQRPAAAAVDGVHGAVSVAPENQRDAGPRDEPGGVGFHVRGGDFLRQVEVAERAHRGDDDLAGGIRRADRRRGGGLHAKHPADLVECVAEPFGQLAGPDLAAGERAGREDLAQRGIEIAAVFDLVGNGVFLAVIGVDDQLVIAVAAASGGAVEVADRAVDAFQGPVREGGAGPAAVGLLVVAEEVRVDDRRAALDVEHDLEAHRFAEQDADDDPGGDEGDLRDCLLVLAEALDGIDHGNPAL